MVANVITLAHSSVASEMIRVEFRGRARRHCAAQFDDPGFDFAFSEAGIELLVQRV
jgi:hypothetical protein